MTASYTTGTVSVQAGNAIVTGVGTGWATSGLVAGQFGLDSANGNPIPVQSIDSDTQITLVKPWRGTNASGQAYWITYDTQPGQQTVSNAQRLAEYIARLDKPTLAALAGLTPEADKIVYFTGPNGAAMADLNAAARALLAGGVLVDGQLPTRLRGAGGPLVSNFNDASQNGFYRAAPDALNAPPISDYWVIEAQRFDNFIRQDAQGTSGSRWYRQGQLGSLPAWSRSNPPERGSNANGEYVRLADGTQICWAYVLLPFASSTDMVATWTFPASFSSLPVVEITGTNDWPNGVIRNFTMYHRATNRSNASSLIVASNVQGNSYSGDSYGVNLIATGRWY